MRSAAPRSPRRWWMQGGEIQLRDPEETGGGGGGTCSSPGLNDTILQPAGQRVTGEQVGGSRLLSPPRFSAKRAPGAARARPAVVDASAAGMARSRVSAPRVQNKHDEVADQTLRGFESSSCLCRGCGGVWSPRASPPVGPWAEAPCFCHLREVWSFVILPRRSLGSLRVGPARGPDELREWQPRGQSEASTASVPPMPEWSDQSRSPWPPAYSPLLSRYAHWL